MNFLYGQLPEIVEDMTYAPGNGDNTIKIDIDNTFKTISANVIKTPGELKIEVEDNKAPKNTSVNFNGSEDKDIKIRIPRYKILNITGDNRDVKGRYRLYEYNYQTNSYDIISGDDIVLEQQLDDLNINNGFGGASLNGIDIINKDENYINPGNIAYGNQSVAFGGYASNLPLINGKMPTQVVNFSEGEYYIIDESPLILILKDKIPTTETIGKNNQIGIGSSYYKYEKNPNNTYTFTNLRNSQIVVNSIKLPFSEVRGNQSIAVGGSVRVNSDYSQAFGTGTIASYPGQMVIGRYNIPVEDALFIIGNGIDEINRSNALVVYLDGTQVLSNELKIEDKTPEDNYNEKEIIDRNTLNNYNFDEGILK